MKFYNSLFSLICTFALLIVSTALFAQENEAPEEGAISEDANGAKPVRPASALPRGRYPHNDQSHMQLLAAHLPKDGLVWVEHNPEPFLGYWQRDRSGQPKGALLVLHSEGASPYWQSTTRPLHESLPEYGWATFSLALPNPAAVPVPSRTIAVKTLPVKPKLEEESEAGVNELSDREEGESRQVDSNKSAVLENQLPVDEVINGRLESALRFLHDRGQYNVVIVGSGDNAIYAQKFINKITPTIQNPQLQGQLEKPIRALVLVNARGYLPRQEVDTVEWFDDPDLPVLDIFIKQDHRNKQAALKRKQLARQQGLVSYTQVAINEYFGESSFKENRLSRRIRSFIEKNASGLEVSGASLAR